MELYSLYPVYTGIFNNTNKLHIMLGVFYKVIKIYVELNRQNKYVIKSLHNFDFDLERYEGDPVAVICC